MTMMRRAATLLLTVSCLAAAARGESLTESVGLDVVHTTDEAKAAAPSGPRLDDVFKSMKNNSRADEAPTRGAPIAIAAAGLVGAAVAVSQWNKRRAAKPKPVGDHRKLLDEIARASGLSRRQLRKLEAAAKAGGLSSPIVAAICPSVLFKRAGAARSGTERSQWVALSRQVAGRRR